MGAVNLKTSQTKQLKMTNMFTALIFCSVIALCTSFHLPATKEAVRCKTDRHEEGTCVQITECETLADILGRPMSKENISYLTKSGCGFENQIPKICCPVEPFPTTTKREDASEAPEETTTDIPTTTFKVSDEFDLNSRNGFGSEWLDYNLEDCIGEICVEANSISTEFL